MEQNNFEKVFEEYKQQSGQEAQMEASQGNSAGKEEFVAVRKNADGDIIAFKTSSGRELDYITALDEAKSGMLAHVDIFHKYGEILSGANRTESKKTILINYLNFNSKN